MAKIMPKSGKQTPEYRALQNNVSIINDIVSIGDTIFRYIENLRAANLSCDVVVHDQRRRSIAHELSDSVLTHVEQSTDKLYIFVEILKKEACFSIIVEKLLQDVGECS